MRWQGGFHCSSFWSVKFGEIRNWKKSAPANGKNLKCGPVCWKYNCSSAREHFEGWIYKKLDIFVGENSKPTRLKFKKIQKPNRNSIKNSIDILSKIFSGLWFPKKCMQINGLCKFLWFIYIVGRHNATLELTKKMVWWQVQPDLRCWRESNYEI